MSSSNEPQKSETPGANATGQGGFGRVLDGLFSFLCSLKLAVIVILGLAAALAAGTILESLYDTQTGQYYVYRSLWFHVLLAMLGVNIFAVMVDRWPWKPRHAPFLLAHIGILILLAGSWGTERFGIDGTLRVAEGETANVVELDETALVMTEGDQIRKVVVPWQPPGTEFRPVSTKAKGLPYDLTIDRFMSHADPIFSFLPNPVPQGEAQPLSAARLRIEGGPMRITQDFWLWMGDASFRSVQMGPARFAIGEELKPAAGQPSLSLVPEKGGGLAYVAHGSDGKTARGRIAGAQAKGQVIQPGWKGGVKLTVLEWIPNAIPRTEYKPARIQYGQMAPPSAIHVISGTGGEGAETWLGLGDRAVLHTEKGNVEIGYLPKRLVLPFSVKLDRFSIDRYEGTMDPSSYSSRVTVDGGASSVISMNEPLTVKGITLYQASYEDAQPRPVVSIFSVNRDPGRFWKYLGSLLIVLGSILLFAVKYRRRQGAARAAAKPDAAPASALARPAPVEVL